jgi:hypothetical protein
MGRAQPKSSLHSFEGPFICSGTHKRMSPWIPSAELCTVLRMRKHVSQLSWAAYNPLDLMQASFAEGARPFNPAAWVAVTTTVMVFRVAVESVEMLHWRV